MTRTALIAGATGLIGKELLHLLVADPLYSSVTVLVRKPLDFKHLKVNEHIIDFEHLDAAKLRFQVDDIYCCLGTTIKVAKSKEAFARVDKHYPVQMAHIAKEQGVKQMLIVSAAGADTRSSVFYSRTKGEMELAIQQSGLASIHIFRPSLLLGKRSEFRLGERISQRLAGLMKLVTRGKLALYRPVEGHTVAQAMIHVARRQIIGTHIYHYPEMMDSLRTTQP